MPGEFRLCPEDIGLILSYRCNSGCKHCLYACGPRWAEDAIPLESLKRALKAMAVFPRTPQIHFTGGEPFLHYSLLVEGVRLAAKLGIPQYAETSASWCTDEAQAAERFSELKAAGLQAILISCSPFHAERIPPIRTLRAIRAALDVFGPGKVMVYLPNFVEVLERFDLDRPTPLASFEEEFGIEAAGQLLWQGYGIISGGRAGYTLGHLAPHYPAEHFADESCGWDLLYARHSHWDLYGNFISSFCGGISMGSWHGLPQLLADAQAGRFPPLIRVLVEQGPYGLFEMAREQHGYEPLPAGYTGKCHLCVDVRRRLVTEGDFAELRPRGFYDNL